MKKKKNINVKRIVPQINKGLSFEEVSIRKDAGLINQTTNPNEKSVAGIILSNVFTLFNSIMFCIALSFLGFIIYLYSTGNSDIVDKHFGFSKFIFLFPVILNSITGSIQQINSKKVLDNLKIVTSRSTKVIRASQEHEIKVHELVVDDLVILNSGDQAGADMILLDGELSVDESMLTGESDYVKKEKGDIIYSGSSIMVGHGHAYVKEVGDNTYASELQKKVKSLSSHKSELLSNIIKILRGLAVVLGIVVITVIITLMIKVKNNGNDAALWDGMVMSLNNPITWARINITAGSFAIGIIPSGLILMTSLSLVLSVVSLAKQNVLVQELYSLENLSRVDTICLDKTGTLTDGTMRLVDVKSYDHLEVIVEHTRNLMGAMLDKNATALAIFERFQSQESDDIEKFIPFSSETKCSGILYKDGKKVLMGAPEYLLDKDDNRLSFVGEKAKEGKRVIALKYDDKLIAFFVIEDHIRESAYDTLKFFRENGVDVKVISGDNPLTVAKIAKDCGVENAHKYISLEGIKLEDIPKYASKYTIFARVSPEQKAALVEALQKDGHKVAMTGDGVNDILALRKADSSITFAKATDAAKSCSDVVLLDNDFSHLKEVVDQGRKVINNATRTSILFLMKSLAIAILAFCLIPLAKGQMWYTIENAYLLEASVIGLSTFFLALEPIKKPIRGTFIQNINAKVIATSLLAVASIMLPILFYTIPTYFGAAPIIKAENVKTMITILLALSGYVTLVSLCHPFNKYRVISCIIVALGATALAFILPTSFVGGKALGPSMFLYDPNAGQTFMDSMIFKEFLRPWNSEVIKNLWADKNTIYISLTYIVVTIPLYQLLIWIINKNLEKAYDKADQKRIAKFKEQRGE